MPIEIRELVIRATITEHSDISESESASTSDSVNEKRIISVCVEQVLKVLDRLKER